MRQGEGEGAAPSFELSPAEGPAAPALPGSRPTGTALGRADIQPASPAEAEPPPLPTVRLSADPADAGGPEGPEEPDSAASDGAVPPEPPERAPAEYPEEGQSVEDPGEGRSTEPAPDAGPDGTDADAPARRSLPDFEPSAPGDETARRDAAV